MQGLHDAALVCMCRQAKTGGEETIKTDIPCQRYPQLQALVHGHQEAIYPRVSSGIQRSASSKQIRHPAPAGPSAQSQRYYTAESGSIVSPHSNLFCHQVGRCWGFGRVFHLVLSCNQKSLSPNVLSINLGML